MEALGDVRLSEELTKKLVGVGCDGENVMVGKKGGVSHFLLVCNPAVSE